MKKQEKILIAGASGMVGSALVRHFSSKGFHHLLTPTHKELDLTSQMDVRSYLKHHAPSVAVVAAARVGGIVANQSEPAPFLYENLMIAANLIHEAHACGIDRLLFLGSSCIYPKSSAQPIMEEALLTGALEPTNEGYALAKIVGVKLCEYYSTQYGRSYISAMPTNLYGPGDNYHPTHSHVIPGLIRRIHEAKMERRPEVEIWGTGKPLREFLYVDDLAEACFHLLSHYHEPQTINIGSGEEISIHTLATTIAQVIDYQGDIKKDLSKPDGMERKRLDLSKIHSLGWRATTPLKEGLPKAYTDFLFQGKNMLF